MILVEVKITRSVCRDKNKEAINVCVYDILAYVSIHVST